MSRIRKTGLMSYLLLVGLGDVGGDHVLDPQDWSYVLPSSCWAGRCRGAIMSRIRKTGLMSYLLLVGLGDVGGNHVADPQDWSYVLPSSCWAGRCRGRSCRRSTRLVSYPTFFLLGWEI